MDAEGGEVAQGERTLGIYEKRPVEWVCKKVSKRLKNGRNTIERKGGHVSSTRKLGGKDA